MLRANFSPPAVADDPADDWDRVADVYVVDAGHRCHQVVRRRDKRILATETDPHVAAAVAVVARARGQVGG